MWALYKKELSLFFKTASGYLFLAICLFLTGVIFSVNFLLQASAAFPDYLKGITILFVLMTPLLTMKLISDEFRYKTDQLLLTAPIEIHWIVLAKFAAVVTIFLLICLIICSYLIVLAAFGQPDWPRIVSAFVGFILLGCTFLSMGLFISSCTLFEMICSFSTKSILIKHSSQ